MSRNADAIDQTHISGWVVIAVFGFIGIIAFGLLIPFLGFYWDDFPLAWITNTFGREGLDRYFSTNRPFWGLLFQVTSPLLGSVPWHWQLFASFWRIVCAISFWYLLRVLWPRKPSVALFAGILFLVYPGFAQHWISIIYSHFFIILTVFILSLALTVKALRALYEQGKSSKVDIYSILALGLSFVNLMTLEYFYTLELIRLYIIWVVIAEHFKEKRERLRKTILVGIPYLTLLVAVTTWRVFFFPYQTNNYSLSLLDHLMIEPIQALLFLVKNILTSIWRVSVVAWINIFRLPDIDEVGKITVILSITLVIVVFLTALIWLYVYISRGKRSDNIRNNDRVIVYQVLMLGVLSLLLGGWAFWLIDLTPDLTFSLDRFTLPFMAGSALLLVGIIELIPVSFLIKSIIIFGLVSLSIGWHFRLANAYRRDWETQRRFFWQLIWRVPDLKTGTTILANELPLTYFSDNSLTAPINWIYAPDNSSENMSFLLAYPARRLGSSVPELARDKPIYVDYLAAIFSGSTSQVITVYYEPPACLRVLDNKLDALNHMLPLLMQHSAELSNQENIYGEVTDSQASMPDMYFPEEEHGWCYYFERAELARQEGNWDEIVALGEIAFSLGDYPNDPAERLPFIEGYARTGNWNRALQLTEESLQVSPKMIPVLCLLWERIDHATSQSPEKEEIIQKISTLLSCSN